ncbi:MAG: TolC family protein [Myxococcales bacterium]|nr:TolC family protein [Myxococcales bacterium]
MPSASGCLAIHGGLLLAALSSVAPVPAAGPEPPSPAATRHVDDPSTGAALRFDEVLGRSSDVPRLRGIRDAGRVKRERDREIPRLTQGPQITVMPGARVHPPENRGLELQITATQAWSLEGYGQRRHETAKAETEVLDAEARAVALEQQLAAAHAWIELHAAELELAKAQQELALARARREALEVAIAAGVGTRPAVVEAHADETELQALCTELAGLVHDLGLVLGREVGSDDPRPLRTIGAHPDPALPDDEELRRRFEQVGSLPAVAVERLRARALRAAAIENAASRGHQLFTGFSVQREATSDLVLFGVVGMSLAGDRGQRQSATAAAEARMAEGRSEQQALELRAVLSTVLHDLHHARERVAILREEVIPTFEALEKAHSTAVDLGEGTTPDLLLARRRRLAAQRRLVSADAALVWARVQAWLYLEAFVAAESSGAEQDP